MKHKFFWLLSVCLFVCFFYSFAQTPKLTADVNGGCSPLSVTFTNQSTGFSGATYTINFGDGGGEIPIVSTSTHTYVLEQRFIATLTVTDGANTYKDTEQITVYKKPIADFTVSNQKACVNTGVDFTSTSTPGDGNIINYVWGFGDGNILDTTVGQVQHKYTSSRSPNINVILKVTDKYGCTNSLTKNNVLTVLAAPKVSFNVNQTFFCNAADPVSFGNTTTGGSLPTTYLWSFGDGKSATDINPIHVYGIKGTFNAKLLATSADGCSDTATTTAITVASSKSVITLPTLLCLNANLTFTDSSLPQTNTPVWLLDGAVAVSNVHQYQTTFTDTKQHTLQLVNNYGACSDTATKIIQAQATPVPSPFTVNVAGNCTVPVNATFTDVGAGTTKWEWDFDNSNLANFNPSAFTKSTTHTYAAENTYYVKLRVTDGSGCTGEIRQPVTIKKNSTVISSTEGATGCKTLSTTFKATSTNPIAQYNWSFNDDNSTSLLDTPHHVFISLGTYQVKLKIRTTGGCNDSALYTIRIGNEPAFDFKLTMPADTLVCGNKIVGFTVTGDTDKLVGQYYWKFGDVNTYSLLTGPIYSHQYTTDSLYDVSLAIKNHGCNDTITKKAFLKVLPPFPKISATINSCDDRLKVVFKETSKKAQTFSWNFGDGSVYTYDSAHRDTAVIHYFPSLTTYYKTILTTTNSICTAKDSSYPRILKKQTPVLSLQQTILCASDSLATTVSNMDFNPYGSGNRYNIKAIEYENNIPFTGTYFVSNVLPVVPFYTNITGLTPGNQKIRIITSSYTFNCPDTTNYIPVQINGPTAGFEVSSSSFCLAEKVFFNDTSKQGGSASIQSWHWFFGDSSEQVLTSGGSTFHNYSNPGSFTAKLIVTDAQNCRDTAYYSGGALTVKGPKARFLIETNPILPNTPENFTNLTDSGYITRASNTYVWDFGDGTSSTSNADKIPHTYKLYSDDTVKLVATSGITGCSDSTTGIVHVKNTNLSFTYALNDSNALCPPVRVNFTNTSLNFDKVSWDFGNQKTAEDNPTPSVFYDKPGTYKITLFGYYDDNTYDSTWDYITIAGPTAVVHADVIPGCGAKQVIFTAQTQNTTSLSWDFQDGTSSPDSIATHYYATPNIYIPVLTVKNGPECVFSYPITTPISIDSIHVDINKDSVIQCHQLLVNFKPAIFSVAKSNNQRVDYSWQFGDGVSTSQDDTTSFTYTKPGTYPVTFIATSLYGCSDTATTEITFADITHATIQGPTEFCENTPQTFTAVKSNSNDALLYHWRFENSTSDLQNPPPQKFTAAWKDSIRLISEYNNCFDTVYHSLIIHNQPQVTFQVSDSVVCSGTAVTFTATPLTSNAQDKFTYKWNFGNGATSQDSLVTYTYPKAGAYLPKLHVDNAGQCSGDFTPVAKMIIDSLSISINKDSVIQCHQLLVNFKPSVFSVAKNNGVEMKYAWQFGDGVSTSQDDTTSFTYTKPGTYPVTFIASATNGCSNTATTEITYTDVFPASIQGPTEFCENTPQVFTAVKTNSNDILTYDWKFENSTSTLQNPPAQTFSATWKDSIRLIVDKNGCKDMIYYKLNIHGNPNIAIGLSDSVSCLGKTIVFTAKDVTTLPEPVAYAWDLSGGNTASQQTTSYNYASVGTYPISLVATSAFGCKQEIKDTVVINPTPVASIQAAQDICIGSTTTFTGSSNVASSQYLWQFGDGTTSTQQSPAKTYASAVTDNFSLIVKAGNCSDTAYKTLIVHNLPLAGITPLVPHACLGKSVQITANGGQSYQWLNASSISDPSVADPLVSPSADTRYTVQVTDAYGCKNTDSVLVKITQPQTLTVISPVSVCIGGKASLTASGTDTYKWTDSIELTSDTLPNPSTKDSAISKTYSVAGSDSYGCFTSTGTVDVIVRNKPVVDASPNQTVSAGTAVQLSASSDDNNVTWNWDPPVYLNCADCESPVSKLKGSTTYTVQATNSYGCKGYDTVRVNVICKESLVNVPQIFTPNSDGVNDKFHILAQGIKTIKHIVIYGRNGNKVFERNDVSPLSNDASWDGMSDRQYMPTGTYIYILQVECDVAGVIFNLQGTVTLVR